MESNLNMDGYQMIEVGRPYPGKCPGMGGQMALWPPISLTIRLDRPSDKEIKAFRSIRAYGFYRGADLPHGLLIWRFSDTFSYETPFNPRLEETLRPEAVKDFLNGKVNMCQRVLIDQDGIVRAIAVLGLDWRLVDLLRKTWADPDLDWSEYDGRYANLASLRTTDELWRKAKTWTVPAKPAFEERSDITVCEECAANRAKAANLRTALKESQSVEAELHKQIADLKNHLSSVEQTKTALEERLSSMSPNALRQEVDSLKAAIDEKDLRILELEEQAKGVDKHVRHLDGRIEDLARHNGYLSGLLRKNGTPFNKVCGHGDGHERQAA